jgi:peptidoglycan glycosyltransferase/penicillin-binding protein 2
VALKGYLIKEKNRVLSKKTANELVNMMQGTMEYGTGNNLKADESTAGKTGSAEAYDNGEYLVHGWFAGFYPVENPKYTVVIFAENGRSGRKSAVPIFEELVKKLP